MLRGKDAVRQRFGAIVGQQRDFGPAEHLAAVNPHFGPSIGLPDEAWDRVMNYNVRSNFWLSNMVLPGMAARWRSCPSADATRSGGHTIGGDPAHHRGMGGGALADQEERRTDAFAR
eukprot:gene1561-2098_t